jgi:F0F1-type ATP synthase assembly protein I
VLPTAGLQDRPKKSGDPFLIAFGIYGGVGMQLALSVVGGLLLGNYLDGRWDTKPWLALSGLTLGAAGGFYNLLKILIWNQRRKEAKRP